MHFIHNLKNKSPNCRGATGLVTTCHIPSVFGGEGTAGSFTIGGSNFGRENIKNNYIEINDLDRFGHRVEADGPGIWNWSIHFFAIVSSVSLICNRNGAGANA